MVGKIEVICGPMFASKTGELLKRIRRLLVTNKKCALITYKKDTRYDENGLLCTHDQIKAPDNENLITISTGEPIDKLLLSDVDTVFIDEGQFMKGLIDFTISNSKNGTNVIISALDMDFRGNPFGEIPHLLCIAHSLKKLTAICYKCNGEAHYSERFTDEQDEEVIGGSDKYRACCKDCFMFGK